MFQNALPAIGLLVLMMLVAWMLQRYKRHLPGRLGQTGVPMQVTGGLSLGPQHRLVSVRIGEGPGQVHMVLGVAPGSITTGSPMARDHAATIRRFQTSIGHFLPAQVRRSAISPRRACRAALMALSRVCSLNCTTVPSGA